MTHKANFINKQRPSIPLRSISVAAVAAETSTSSAPRFHSVPSRSRLSPHESSQAASLDSTPFHLGRGCRRMTTKKIASLQVNLRMRFFCSRAACSNREDYLFENCGARRAALRPYFFLSFIRGSLVRYPADLRTGL